MLRAMTSERRSSSSPGGWFLLWGMLLLSIWMSPVPADTSVKVTYTRVALVLVAIGTAVFAALQLERDRARAFAAFLRAIGTLALAAGIWSASGPWVIQTVPARAAVLTFAAACLLAAFVRDLAREPAKA